MEEDDVRGLVGGYATNNLNQAERDRLFKAVLNDQSLFEDVAPEEKLRLVFSDPVFRARITARLRERRPWFSGFRAVILVTGALAASVVAGVVAYRNYFEPEKVVAALNANRELIGGSDLTIESKGLSTGLPPDAEQTPQARAAQAQISLDRPGTAPMYRLGDPQRIGFRVSSRAQVLLVEKRPDGSEIRLFPNRFQSSPAVVPGETVLIPPAGQGNLAIEGAAGERTLRLYIFNREAPDPTDPLTQWSELKKSAKVVVQNYVVNP